MLSLHSAFSLTNFSCTNISRFFPCLSPTKKRNQKDTKDSVPLITAIGSDASWKVSDYGISRAREPKGRRWMYLPCATVPWSSDKFVAPSCCGQHRPARIYEVRWFNGGAPLQTRWCIARMGLPWVRDRVMENENIVVHIDDFIECRKRRTNMFP